MLTPESSRLVFQCRAQFFFFCRDTSLFHSPLPISFCLLHTHLTKSQWGKELVLLRLECFADQERATYHFSVVFNPCNFSYKKSPMHLTIRLNNNNVHLWHRWFPPYFCRSEHLVGNPLWPCHYAFDISFVFLCGAQVVPPYHCLSVSPRWLEIKERMLMEEWGVGGGEEESEKGDGGS